MRVEISESQSAYGRRGFNRRERTQATQTLSAAVEAD
jgi:hypothetical protein